MKGLDNNEEAKNLVENFKGSTENRMRSLYNLGYWQGFNDGQREAVQMLERALMDMTAAQTEQTEPQLTAKCLNCANSGSYKCSKCDGEMYYKDDPQFDKDINVRCKDEPQTVLEAVLEKQTTDDRRKMAESVRKAIKGEPQTKLCRECDDYAGDGMYCASNHIVYDFSTSKGNCEPQTERSEQMPGIIGTKEMLDKVQELKEQVLLSGFKRTEDVDKFFDEHWMYILDILDDALYGYLTERSE